MNKFKRVLVTGGFGFIGSHFIDLLKREYNMEIILVDKLTYATKYNFQDINDNIHFNYMVDSVLANYHKIKFYKADIANKELIYHILNETRPDAIVNFAAESHVDRSLSSKDDVFMNSNVIGVKNFLDYMRENPETVRKFVQVSTDEVGGVWLEGSFNEQHMRHPRNPYSATKAAAEMFCEAYHANFNLPIVITRGSNTYGPRQYPEKLIPLFILRLLENKNVGIYDHGIQIRDWLHVEDHAGGIKFALEHGLDGEVYHIGGEHEIQNIEVIDKIFDYLQKPDTLKDWTASRLGHDQRYSLDCDKLKLLGWERTKTFDVEIEKTIQWYVDNKDKFGV